VINSNLGPILTRAGHRNPLLSQPANSAETWTFKQNLNVVVALLLLTVEGSLPTITDGLK